MPEQMIDLYCFADEESAAISPQPGGAPAPQTDHYRSLLANHVDSVFSIDVHGNVVEVNRAAEQLIGYSLEQLRATSLADRCLPEKRQRAVAFFAQAAAGSSHSLDTTLVHRDGEPVDVELSASPIMSGGAVVGVFCVARDVTRRRRSEADLRKACREAESAKERFLADVSHELRTPLMPALTVVQLLEHHNELPADVQESLAMVRRNLELEARLIDDLLDLSKIRQGKLGLNVLNVDLHCKINHVLKSSDEEIAAKGLRVTTDLAAEDHRLAGDPSRIHQILWNVISNAIKFTPPGGAIRITSCNGRQACSLAHRTNVCRQCTTQHKAEFVGIHVTDTGVGIAPESLERLFEAFNRGETHGDATAGRGVGLAISRALVELHGGRMMVHSEGRHLGATFSIMLPLNSASIPAAERPTVTHKGAKASNTRRVLLVEDHADTAKALARLLSRIGLDVTVAGTVSDARAEAARTHFDLLISDIGLPDGTGHDVVRSIHRRYNVPAIALSGYGMDDDIQRSHDAGFSDHLVKPINIVQFQQAINRLLAVD